MPADTDDRCGTCRWWPVTPGGWSKCLYDAPEPVAWMDRDVILTAARDGCGCPCWERRLNAGSSAKSATK
jgi:hypothetical protein